jgi:hypothetical protein
LIKTVGPLVVVLLLVPMTPAAADDWLFRRELIGEPARDRFSVCFDHSCRSVVTRAFSRSEWQRIAAAMQPPAPDSARERAAIAHTIAIMEQIIGEKTGTAGDQGGNMAGFGRPGQMDCIDESNNTTTYLKLLQQDGLLNFHKVMERSTRFGLFAGMPHTTAVIRDITGRQDYAVDSWFFDNGEPPGIVELQVWKAGWRPDGELHE